MLFHDMSCFFMICHNEIVASRFWTMQKDGIDEVEWPSESAIKTQNSQARPKEVGPDVNSAAKPPSGFLPHFSFL